MSVNSTCTALVPYISPKDFIKSEVEQGLANGSISIEQIISYPTSLPSCMNSYIKKNYTVVWQHPEASSSDWNIFLLGETHDDKLVRKVNGLFTSLFATPDSFFLAECHHYLQKSKTPKHIMRRYLIQTLNIKSERILGWDNCDFYIKEPLFCAYEIASDIFEKYFNYHDTLCQINWKATLEKSIKNQYDFEDEFNLKPIIKKAICKVGKEMHQFIHEQLNPIVEQIKSDKEKCSKMKANLEFLSKNLKEDLPTKDFDQMIEKYPFSKEGYKNCRLQIIENEDNLDACIYNKRIELMKKRRGCDDFPERTQCMVKTLDYVSKFISGSKSRAFLIAGSHHLEERLSLMSPERQKLCSLGPLHHFLEDHKNIVILKPRD